MKGFKLVCLECGAENIITDKTIECHSNNASIYVFEEMNGDFEIECNKCGNKI